VRGDLGVIHGPPLDIASTSEHWPHPALPASAHFNTQRRAA